MIVKYYPNGYMEQEGTPKEIAQYQFALASLNTLQSFKKLLDAIPAAMEKKDGVTVTIPENPKRKGRSRKAADDDKT